MEQLLEYQADLIETVLERHRLSGRVTGGTVTPRWTSFQVVPAIGARISAIRGLSEELAAALDAPSVRVARQGAAVQVEVPRADPGTVTLVSLLQSLPDIPPATAVLGLGDDGAPLLIRLSSPDVAHVLVAGTTGSGKTALLRTMIVSLAVAQPRRGALALVLVDPKGRAFGDLVNLPQLARPVVVEVEEAVEALGSLVRLMEQRDRMSESNPPVVLFIDELTDLMMIGGTDAEQRITRLVQRGREAGIHVVAATQKPSAAVIGSLVKANFPVRLVGKVTSPEDARVASGRKDTGADRLLGRGDFVAVAEGRLFHFQAAYAATQDIAEMMGRFGQAVRQLQPDDDERRISTALAIPEMAAASAPAPQVVIIDLPDPPQAVPDEVDVLVARLEQMGWDVSLSYRQACRALGEAEGGRRFGLVREAVNWLRERATATATIHSQDGSDDSIASFGDGSGSTEAVVRAMGWCGQFG